MGLLVQLWATLFITYVFILLPFLHSLWCQFVLLGPLILLHQSERKSQVLLNIAFAKSIVMAHVLPNSLINSPHLYVVIKFVELYDWHVPLQIFLDIQTLKCIFFFMSYSNKTNNFFFQDLSKIYSLICTITYKILNDFWKKLSWNWIMLTNSTCILSSRFIIVCTCKLSKNYWVGINKYYVVQLICNR